MKTVNIREVPLSEIVDLSVYPVADILPMLEKNSSKREEGKTRTVTLSEIAGSILENGLLEPIVLFESDNGKFLLDGRNRREACKMAAQSAGVPFNEFLIPVEDFEGTEEEADKFVFVEGFDRRDLEASQRAMSAAKFATDPSTKPSFERMKEKAGLIQKEAGEFGSLGGRGNKTLSAPVQEGFRTTSEVADILAKRFRCSVRYVYEAFKIVNDKIAARKAVERAAQRAEEYEQAEKEAKVELHEAVAVGDTEKMREASTKANNAASHKVEEREKVAVFAQEASQKQADEDNVHGGKKKLSEIRKERKESGMGDREIAITSASAQLNDGYNKFITAGMDLIEFGRPENLENIRLKLIEFNSMFGWIKPQEGLIDAEENRDRFNEIERSNAEFGQNRMDSPTVEVSQTKPCGCDYSDLQSCNLCKK